MTDPEPRRGEPLPGGPPRQRWRLVVAMPAARAPGDHPSGARGWAAVVAASGLPLAGEAGGRGRVVPAATLPLGVAGQREIVDVYLAERMTAADVRLAAARALPAGWSLVEVHDVWVGAPAAPAAVVAADYRAVLAGVPRAALEAAAVELLAAGTLPRERRREKKTTAYDLRPLILDLRVGPGAGSEVAIGMRLRHGSEATGRPDEVVAALGEAPAPPLPGPLEVRSMVRERLLMADDPDAPAPP